MRYWILYNAREFKWFRDCSDELQLFEYLAIYANITEINLWPASTNDTGPLKSLTSRALRNGDGNGVGFNVCRVLLILDF